MKAVFSLCAAAVLSLASHTVAQQPSAELDTKAGLSVDLSLTIPTSYVFRGYVIQDERFIVQPEAFVTYTTAVGGFEVAPYVGAWANLIPIRVRLSWMGAAISSGPCASRSTSARR
jgi:hypothetical protein